MDLATPLALVEFAIVDTETTGLTAADRICEVAVVRGRLGRLPTCWSQLVRPHPWRPIPAFILAKTGLDPRALQAAPTFAEIAPTFHTAVAGAVLVAHNLPFDRKMLGAEYARLTPVPTLPTPHLDTCRLARRVLPTSPDHKLGTLVAQYRLPIPGAAHRAGADALMTWHLLAALLGTLQARGRTLQTLGDLLAVLDPGAARLHPAVGTAHPAAPTLALGTPGPALPLPPSLPPPDSRRILVDRLQANRPPRLVTAIQYLNRDPQPRAAALQGMSVGGQDSWSRLPLGMLQARAGSAAVAQVGAAFPGRAERQAAVLRWALRGLALELAVWKGWLLEAGQAEEPLPDYLPIT